MASSYLSVQSEKRMLNPWEDQRRSNETLDHVTFSYGQKSENSRIPYKICGSGERVTFSGAWNRLNEMWSDAKHKLSEKLHWQLCDWRREANDKKSLLWRMSELKKDFAGIHFARLSNFQYSISEIGFKILNCPYESFPSFWSDFRTTRS